MSTPTLAADQQIHRSLVRALRQRMPDTTRNLRLASVELRVETARAGTAPVERWDGSTWEPVGDLFDVPGLDCFSSGRILSLVPNPDGDSVLVRASERGTDAAVVVEVDLGSGTPRPGDFAIPSGRGGLDWLDADRVLAFHAATDSELTDAGHPRVVRVWRRGEPLAAATELFRVPADSLTVTARALTPEVFVVTDHTRTGRRHLVVGLAGTRRPLDLAEDARVHVGAGGLFIDSGSGGGGTPADALLHRTVDRDGCLGPTQVIRARAIGLQVRGHQRGAAVITSDHGCERVEVVTRIGGGWQVRTLGVWPGACDLLAVDDREVVLRISTPTTPPEVIRCATERRRVDRRTGAFGDRAARVSHHTTPHASYHVAGPGVSGHRAPTLVGVYGGFGASVRPEFRAEFAAGWLERGGTLALAQIRGGGERGARHRAEGRGRGKLRAVADLAEICHDLVARELCDPASLACLGSSNGGLITALTALQHPGLFAGAVLNNPLLDLSTMEARAAGRGWAGEYGSWSEAPEAARAVSPLHQIPDDCSDLPRLLVATQRHDDRIDGAGARTFVDTVRTRGGRIDLLEGEGSHRGPIDREQGIVLLATIFTFLHDTTGSATC